VSRVNQTRVKGLTAIAPLVIGVPLTLAPGMASLAWAHQVQIAEDVGATLHIEPNDVPRAGEATQAWFALTKAGGTGIPLAACDCTLTLFSSDGTAIATPALAPLSAEGYTEIPSAMVTFPTVGAYTLVLAGAPRNGADFAPFELRFNVTVAGIAPNAQPPAVAVSPPETVTEAAGSSAQPSETPLSPSTSSPLRKPLAWGGLVLAVGILWGLVGRRKSTGGGAS
jgi:hypothetical protein